jgi:acetyl esterase/lipase
MIDRRTVLIGSAAVAAASHARAGDLKWPEPRTSIPLWPDGAPGALGALPKEVITERSKDDMHKDRAIAGIGNPRLQVFPARKPNGAAVLLMPGGAYARIAFDREGYEMADWFNARGITAFVLFYRLPHEGWADQANVALADAQRAMRLIRARAGEYKLDPARLMAMGFSAGGHLCADLATRFEAKVYAPIDAADALSARPALAAPIYPVVSMSAPYAHALSRNMLLGDKPPPEREAAHSPDHNVTKDTPPCFQVHAADDPSVPVENTLMLNAALRKAGVPAEMHVFEKGGHGFGLRNVVGMPAHVWPELFMTWAGTRISLSA